MYVTYVDVYNLDNPDNIWMCIICVSESYLDFSVSSGKEDINIKDYKLVRTSNPNKTKRDAVCAYFWEPLPVRIVSDHHLNEYLILKINLNKAYVVSLYCSPS